MEVPPVTCAIHASAGITLRHTPAGGMSARQHLSGCAVGTLLHVTIVRIHGHGLVQLDS
jgi:hypothetical protein